MPLKEYNIQRIETSSIWLDNTISIITNLIFVFVFIFIFHLVCVCSVTSDAP